MELLEEIKKLYENKNEIIKTSDLKKMGINNYQISNLIEHGHIERIKRGIYRLTDSENEISEAALVSKLFPDGVLCMYAALFYYGYSDRTPLNWDIAINKDTSRSRFRLDYPYVQPYFLEPEQLIYGISTAHYEDCEMKIFDKDRLICECLKYENKMEKESFNKAIQAYINDSGKNMVKLLEYAKKRRIDKKMKDRIGVWL